MKKLYVMTMVILLGFKFKDAILQDIYTSKVFNNLVESYSKIYISIKK